MPDRPPHRQVRRSLPREIGVQPVQPQPVPAADLRHAVPDIVAEGSVEPGNREPGQQVRAQPDIGPRLLPDHLSIPVHRAAGLAVGESAVVAAAPRGDAPDPVRAAGRLQGEGEAPE